MVEKNPWWKNVQGPFPSWEGPVGVKEDGGGCHRGRGKVGKMLIHTAVNNHDKEGGRSAFLTLSEHSLAGNTATHCCEGTDRIFNAPHKRDELVIVPSAAAGVVQLVDSGENVNEVEAAGNTPLHCAAYEGWLEGVELLLNLGAKLDASNNAGDRPWHWADNMGHDDVKNFLVKVSTASSF